MAASSELPAESLPTVLAWYCGSCWLLQVDVRLPSQSTASSERQKAALLSAQTGTSAVRPASGASLPEEISVHCATSASSCTAVGSPAAASARPESVVPSTPTDTRPELQASASRALSTSSALRDPRI